jgi:hypothetical protein
MLMMSGVESLDDISEHKSQSALVFREKLEVEFLTRVFPVGSTWRVPREVASAS